MTSPSRATLPRLDRTRRRICLTTFQILLGHPCHPFETQFHDSGYPVERLRLRDLVMACRQDTLAQELGGSRVSDSADA